MYSVTTVTVCSLEASHFVQPTLRKGMKLPLLRGLYQRIHGHIFDHLAGGNGANPSSLLLFTFLCRTNIRTLYCCNIIDFLVSVFHTESFKCSLNNQGCVLSLTCFQGTNRAALPAGLVGGAGRHALLCEEIISGLRRPWTGHSRHVIPGP